MAANCSNTHNIISPMAQHGFNLILRITSYPGHLRLFVPMHCPVNNRLRPIALPKRLELIDRSAHILACLPATASDSRNKSDCQLEWSSDYVRKSMHGCHSVDWKNFLLRFSHHPCIVLIPVSWRASSYLMSPKMIRIDRICCDSILDACFLVNIECHPEQAYSSIGWITDV